MIINRTRFFVAFPAIPSHAADTLSQRGVGRVAAETTEAGVPLHKKVPVQKGHDTEQPLRVGERQEPEEVQARPTGIRELRLGRRRGPSSQSVDNNNNHNNNINNNNNNAL